MSRSELFVVDSVLNRFSTLKEPLPNVYQVKLPTWLTKFMLKHGFLKQFIQDVEVVKTTRIDTGSFIHNLLRSVEHIEAEHLYEAEEVLVGRDLYREFLGSNELRGMLQFTAPTDLRHSHGQTVCGIKIKVIPWMTGFVIIPKER